MRIMMVTAELAPLIQSGGLGDMVSGLARSLGARGHDVVCVLPAYRDALMHPSCPMLHRSHDVRVDMFGNEAHGRWLRGELFPGVRLAMLDMPSLFARPGIYGDSYGGYGDNGYRFIALSRAAAFLAEYENPDVLVAHDHHAALSLCSLRTALDRGRNRGIGTVQVVHNNAYQGSYAPDDFRFCGLPLELFHVDGLEKNGTLNLLKAGLGWSDRIVAVSPTYAREVQTHQCGQGLQGLYATRSHRLSGIPNGIDIQRFDPATDPHLPARFSADEPGGKQIVRNALCRELGLHEPEPGKLCVAIGRLATQKGWDVLASAIDLLVSRGCSVATLGDGDVRIAERLAYAARKHRGRVAVRFGFDDGLARRMYAGGDNVLVPSRFEPCGLVQRIAQRYGTVPVAHAVGGLVDTINDPAFDPGKKGTDENTGILFAPLTPEAITHGVLRAAQLAETVGSDTLQRRLMSMDVSWAEPAKQYEAVFEAAAAEGRARL